MTSYNEGDRVQWLRSPEPASVVKAIPAGHEIVMWGGYYKLAKHADIQAWTAEHDELHRGYLRERSQQRRGENGESQ